MKKYLLSLVIMEMRIEIESPPHSCQNDLTVRRPFSLGPTQLSKFIGFVGIYSVRNL